MTERDDQARRRPSHRPRLRLDEFAPGPGATEPTSHSGRRLVLVAGLALVVLWGALQAAFQVWRSGYRKRADFGATRVAPAIDPLAEIVPPGVEPDAWRRAVAETHEAIVTLTAANLLDLAQMRALRDDLTACVTRARAQPETARAELAGLWNELAHRAGPVLNARHPRPALLPPPDPRIGPPRRNLGR